MKSKKFKIDPIFVNFNKKERSAFKKYLKEGHVRATPFLRKMVDYLFKFHTKFKCFDLTNEEVYAAAQSGIYNGQVLKVQKSNLKKIAEDFLIAKYLEKNKYQKSQLLAKVYQERELEDAMKQQTNLLLKKIKGKPVKSDVDYLSIYELHYLLWEQSSLDKWQVNHPHFIEASIYLDDFYILKRLQHLLEWNVRRKILNESYSPFEDSFVQISIVKLAVNSKNKKIRLLAKLWLLQEQENTIEAIQAFYHSFLLIRLNLEKEFARDIVIHTYNLYNLHLKQGSLEVSKWQLKLYQDMVEFDLLCFDQQLRAAEFWNIINLGYANLAFDWTEKFVHDHLVFLNDLEKSISEQYAKALKAFHQNDFEETLNLLEGAEERLFERKHAIEHHESYRRFIGIERTFSNIQAIRVKSLRLRAFFECEFYEQGDYDNLYDKYRNAFKYALKKEKILHPKIVNNYLDFIYFLQKIPTIQSLNKAAFNEIAEQIKEKKTRFTVLVIGKISSVSKIITRPKFGRVTLLTFTNL